MATLTTSYQKIATSSTVSFNGATGKIELYAKYNSQSTANNSTNYSIQPRLVVANGYIGEYTGTTLTISGTGLTTSTTSKGTGNFKSQTLGTLTGTVTHNADGTKSVSMSSSIKFKAWGKTISVSGSATLPTIPRYFTTAPKVELQSKTETTATFKWSTSETCDRIDYAIDGGSGITCFTGSATSGTFTVSGLGANTSHSLFIWGRRKDSQLGTTGNTVSFTTYNYPYCTSTPNFTIGNTLTLSFYNPLKRNITVKGYSKTSGGQIFSGSTTGTSLSGFNDSSSITSQYNSIPKATNSKYKVTVTYGSAVMTRDAGNTYSIDASKCTPTFTNFDYIDTDGTVQPLVGNNKILVNGNSDCKFVISTTNKAVARNGASITKYVCYWGTKTNEVAYSSNAEVSCSIYDSTGNTLKVVAVDSRGLTTAVTKTITNIAYASATVNNLETQRLNGVDSITYLQGKFNIWNGSWNASSDTATKNRLKYVGYSVLKNGTWSEYYSITEEVLEKATITENGSVKTYSINFDDEIALHLDGISGGFAIGTEYEIKVLIKDGNSTTIFTPYSYQALGQAHITDGKVSTSQHKDNNGDYHMGINAMSDDAYNLLVNGNIGVNTDGIDFLNKNGEKMARIASSETYKDLFLDGYGGYVYIRPNGDTTNAFAFKGDGELIANKFTGTLNGNAKTATSATSATSATKASQDGSGNVIVDTYSRAGTVEKNVSFDSVGTSGGFYRSGLYSTYIGTAWYNLINIRHRNGNGDGTGYGSQIRVNFSAEPDMRVRGQTNGTWGSWRKIPTILNESATKDYSGYIKLNNGLLIQWGVIGVPCTANKVSSQAFSFPIAYSSYMPCVTCSVQTGVIYSEVKGYNVANISKTGATAYVYRSNSNSTGVFWIAIGY